MSKLTKTDDWNEVRTHQDELAQMYALLVGDIRNSLYCNYDYEYLYVEKTSLQELMEHRGKLYHFKGKSILDVAIYLGRISETSSSFGTSSVYRVSQNW